MRNLKRLLLNNLLIALVAGVGLADQMSSQNSDYVITKDLWGATGNASVASADSSLVLAFGWGEPISGDVISNSTDTIISGYYGGRFGSAQTIQLVSSLVGAPGSRTYFQDQVQVGVALNAPVQLTFSDQLDVATISSGVQAVISTDHLGRSSNMPFSVTIDTRTDPTNRSFIINPTGAWLGNTFYDIQLNQPLLSIDGFPLDKPYHVYFLTVLDPHQDNVVLNPIGPSGAASTSGSAGAMSIQIPTESLSDYSTILMSRDPLSAPLHADPKIIQAANAKALAAGGPYRTPITIQEINAYNTSGNLMGPLSVPAQISITYGPTASLIRPQTLSFWVLDETHSLWVKIPASQNVAGLHMVSAPITEFTVFALMGSADGSASDSFAFPVPWRPHGPNAGTGAGQTGTEAGGITFSNLPSECSIKIYTIAGDLVRQIEHSDTGGLIGQETWDVKTTHGETVASGVYLWRVESSVDGKNGKLMVIR